jgi:predicted  nucleic acid-binding Zn-ribbon protein
MTMYRGMATTMEQADSMQRDALISALKKELYDLQDREHEYLSLNDEINNVETKYSMLKEEKERIENEHRYFFHDEE